MKKQNFYFSSCESLIKVCNTPAALVNRWAFLSRIYKEQEQARAVALNEGKTVKQADAAAVAVLSSLYPTAQERAAVLAECSAVAAWYSDFGAFAGITGTGKRSRLSLSHLFWAGTKNARAVAYRNRGKNGKIQKYTGAAWYKNAVAALNSPALSCYIYADMEEQEQAQAEHMRRAILFGIGRAILSHVPAASLHVFGSRRACVDLVNCCYLLPADGSAFAVLSSYADAHAAALSVWEQAQEQARKREQEERAENRRYNNLQISARKLYNEIFEEEQGRACLALLKDTDARAALSGSAELKRAAELRAGAATVEILIEKHRKCKQGARDRYAAALTIAKREQEEREQAQEQKNA